MPTPSPHHRTSTWLDLVEELIARDECEQAKAILVREAGRMKSSVDPGIAAEVASAMSKVCWGLGDLDQAEYHAKRTTSLLPGDGYALHNYGNLLVNIGRHADALPVLEHAQEILELRDKAQREVTESSLFRAHALEPLIARTNALAGLHRHDSAVALLRTALQTHPNDPRLLANLAANLHASGYVEEALSIAFKARQLAPRSASAAELVCAMLNYAPQATKDETFDAHRHYGDVLLSDLADQGHKPIHARRSAESTQPPSDATPKSRKLRIGFLSADLRSHAVAYFAWPILEHAKEAGASVWCYHVGIREDDVSKELRVLVTHSGGAWRHVPTKTIPALAEIIRRDHLDVLIDLSGHTSGHRLPVMALRPAPLCCTYFGYPNTTGVPGVDLRIVDSSTDPAGEEHWNTERLLRVDPLFCVYRPPNHSPDVSPLPVGDSSSASARNVTFGCFGSLLKYNKPLLALWARVLQESAGSRLVLMHHAMTEQSVRDRICRQIADQGIEPSRIECRAPAPDARGTLVAYRDIDIALDTWPYSGTTTVCESLWMGVPMVTLAGSAAEGSAANHLGHHQAGASTDRCAARVTASMLKTVGLPQLIARTKDEYVAIARQLASPQARAELIQLRQTLREQVLASPMCDSRSFTSRFVNLLRERI